MPEQSSPVGFGCWSNPHIAFCEARRSPYARRSIYQEAFDLVAWCSTGGLYDRSPESGTCNIVPFLKMDFKLKKMVLVKHGEAHPRISQ